MAGTASIAATLVDDHPLWGACVFLEAKGEPEAIRGEYARRAEEWPPLHFAIVEPVSAGALDPWYRLGFAQMHAYGMRESGAERAVVPGVTIRRGGPGDIETAIRIDRLIHDAQAATPSFSSETFDADVHRRNWEETLDGGDVRYLLAERRGGPVGHLTLYADPHDDDALHIASTAVVPEERGAGIGVALTTHALALAAEAGHPRVWTNWRVTNLGASRFWPSRGFRLARLRLVRRVPDPW